EKKEEKKEGPLSAEDIQYPVPGLGGCQNEAECRSYCDNTARAKECFAFAKKYNLISAEEAKKAADQFLNVKNGPGGCNSGASCEAYCSNVDHLDACIAFAEENDYYSGDELAEAKKIQALVKAGKQFPGGCKDRNACEIYCGDPNHMEECLDFAEESGFMPKEEIEQARKILPLMKRGETPGKCTSKEQCEAYCLEESHSDECIAFGEKAGLISAEDAAVMKKTGGKGPGSCRSKEQCEAYCENNSDECFQWAQDNGLVSEDDLSKMKQGMVQFKEQLDKIPPEVTQCLKDSLGEKNFDKMVNGQPIFDREMEGKMKSCFKELTSQVSKQFNTLPPEASQCIKDVIGEEGLRKLQSGEIDESIDFSSLEGCFQQLQSSFGGGAGGPGGFSGPGGCKSIDECTAYCQSNPDACKDFAPPGGGQGGGFSGGPGGCQSQEDCMAYCKEHQEECEKFSPPSGSGSPGSSNGGGTPFSMCVKDGMEEVPVCGVNGKGAEPGVETTYFNECHAKQHGVQILHDGVCKGHVSCANIAHPVCGTDGGTYVAACHAKENGTEVKHEGECTSADFGGGGNGGPSSSFSGPGGCKSQQECTAYCQTNYSDPACSAYGPGGNTGGGTQSCVQPPSGLVSWWSADIVSGATVSDISDGNNGTIAGGVTTISMEVGDAFQFDGSSGRISMGNPANLNFGTGSFSLETWFNWDGRGTSANNIIRKSNYPVTGPGSGYWLRIGGGTLEFSVGATTGPEGQSLITAPISSGTWHHVVAVRDSSPAIKLYIDGKSEGTILRHTPGTESSSEAPFTLGAWDDRFGVTEFFHGQVDDVSVYNRGLTASEVQDLFESGSIGKCATGYGRTNRELPQDYQQQQPEQQQYQQSQPADFSGPGGCKTSEECTAYCAKNYEDQACQQFVPPSAPSSLLPFSSLLGTVLGPFLEIVR
ncbi:MAG: LamG-like jellyroll fold domain-containing protein, partial [Candidatus Sungbacteria bacterium]|nr:LamG-like jellyroll fold domain-containing protein [Candidatus Sungbacteria bacterium]